MLSSFRSDLPRGERPRPALGAAVAANHLTDEMWLSFGSGYWTEVGSIVGPIPGGYTAFCGCAVSSGRLTCPSLDAALLVATMPTSPPGQAEIPPLRVPSSISA